MNGGELAVSIWRGDATEGAFRDYRVPARESQTVLDVVTWVQRHAEPGLAYRFACRVGMCGSCAMTVNGRPRWTCRSHVKDVMRGDRVEIAPLRNFPVIRDLVADMSGFFGKWADAGGPFRATATREDGPAPVTPADPARRAANAGIECINCGVCHAACDVVAADRNYLGPAALNRAWTLVNDVRDGARAARLRAVTAAGGCQNCHAMASCSAHCPNLLDPSGAIAGLKRTAFLARFGGR